MSKIQRNPQETKRKILAAATAEFKEHGPHGARIDTIIKNAGVNKRMIYHYFGDKDGLFNAVMDNEIDFINKTLADSPRDEVFESVYYWHSKREELDSFLKLCCWVDSDRDDVVVAEDRRKKIFKDSAQVYRELKKQGKIPDHLDPKYVLLSLMSISAFPMIVPKLAKLITGEEISSKKFEREYMKVIQELIHFSNG